MTAAFWTRLAIIVLIVVPPVIFGLFLRDAAALMRGLDAGPDVQPDSGVDATPGDT